MANHSSKISMQKEALQEMIEVAEYCIEFDKSKNFKWEGKIGCYGYPGALLLLSIVDCIGEIIKKGGDDVSQHFTVLNEKDYYNLSLKPDELNALERSYRNKLSHNGSIREGVKMDIGNIEDVILKKDTDGEYILFLKPFLNISKKVVNKFIIENP